MSWIIQAYSNQGDRDALKYGFLIPLYKFINYNKDMEWRNPFREATKKVIILMAVPELFSGLFLLVEKFRQPLSSGGGKE